MEGEYYSVGDRINSLNRLFGGNKRKEKKGNLFGGDIGSSGLETWFLLDNNTDVGVGQISKFFGQR